MAKKIIVVFKEQDTELEDKKRELETKYSNREIEFFSKVPDIIDPDLYAGCKVILDFDLSISQHLELLDLVKKTKSFDLDFLVDEVGEQEFIPSVTKQLREKIDKFIEMLLPLREEISNEFVNLPDIKMVKKEHIFSHIDESALYFFSSDDLACGETKVSIWYILDGETTEIVCEGELVEVEAFDEDKTDKTYYEFNLADSSWEKLKDYFDKVQELNEIIEAMCES